MNEFKMKAIWRGKDLEECTKEELKDLIQNHLENVQQLDCWGHEAYIRDLKKELEIKDALLDKFIK